MPSDFFGLMSNPVSYAWASLLVRLATGIALLPYGIKKLTELKSLADKEPPKIFAVGPFSARSGFISVTIIETLVPILLILGFCTRLAVIPCFFSMLVAFRANHGEYGTAPSSIYILLMIAIFFIGSGQYSLDYFFMGAR